MDRSRRRSGSSWCISFSAIRRAALFLTTNAGSTGLNLQAANTVINVDLPWNPAVLEQRIARAHRMGQKNPVQVYLLVTEGTIEEKLLATLSAKHDLALAALDMESDVREVALASGMEELKRRLEVLLGAKAHAAVDETEKQRQQQEAERLARRSRVAEAGGQLLSAAFAFLGEMIPQREDTNGAGRMASEFKARLDECLERDEPGPPAAHRHVANEAALEKLARSAGRAARLSRALTRCSVGIAEQTHQSLQSVCAQTHQSAVSTLAAPWR